MEAFSRYTITNYHPNPIPGRRLTGAVQGVTLRLSPTDKPLGEELTGTGTASCTPSQALPPGNSHQWIFQATKVREVFSHPNPEQRQGTAFRGSLLSASVPVRAGLAQDSIQGFTPQHRTGRSAALRLTLFCTIQLPLPESYSGPPRTYCVHGESHNPDGTATAERQGPGRVAHRPDQVLYGEMAKAMHL